jgi:hypothetical protein
LAGGGGRVNKQRDGKRQGESPKELWKKHLNRKKKKKACKDILPLIFNSLKHEKSGMEEKKKK